MQQFSKIILKQIIWCTTIQKKIVFFLFFIHKSLMLTKATFICSNLQSNPGVGNTKIKQQWKTENATKPLFSSNNQL